MSILYYKPARDARHRAACNLSPPPSPQKKKLTPPPAGLALYRSLLRLSTRIPLPAPLSTSGPLRSPSSPTGQNPLRALVTRSFTLHRPLTSPRLITSALSQGYRFLTLLTAEAASPSRRLLAFLSANAARIQTARAERAALRAKYTPGKDLVPLITKVADNPPRYEPTGPPRAVEAGKVRWVPKFDDCGGIPFLRMRGRQSFVLSAVLNRKLGKRRERLELVEEMMGEGVRGAEEEDDWEGLVGAGERNRGRWGIREGWGNRGGQEGTWQGEARRGAEVVSGLLNDEMKDMVARSRGYWKVLEQEREEAGRERRVRRKMEREKGVGEGGGGEGDGGETKTGRADGKTRRAYERRR